MANDKRKDQHSRAREMGRGMVLIVAGVAILVLAWIFPGPWSRWSLHDHLPGPLRIVGYVLGVALLGSAVVQVFRHWRGQ